MRYAIVESGVVVNVALADAPIDVTWVELPADSPVCAGWSYDGAVFAAPTPPAPVVPTQCTRRQGRLALLGAGYLTQVESAIAAIVDDTQRIAAQIEYEADTWERDNVFLQSMWAQLGGTEAELDALFTTAVTL